MRPGWLFDHRSDQPGEVVPGAVQAALDRSEGAPGDLGDLLVALAVQFAEHEDDAVVFGQLPDRLVNLLAQSPPPVEIVGTGLGSSHSSGLKSASQFFIKAWKSTTGFRERFLSSFLARLPAMV